MEDIIGEAGQCLVYGSQAPTLLVTSLVITFQKDGSQDLEKESLFLNPQEARENLHVKETEKVLIMPFSKVNALR